MNRPGFFHGVAIAIVLGLAASLLVAAMLPFVTTATVARFVIAGLALAYLLYLLSQSGERTGRVTVLATWAAMTLATWWFVPWFPLYLLIQVAAIWLVRSLYFYSGVFPALLDLGLCGLSTAFALGTLARTGSVFLAAWCFFLVQALFVAIPPTMRKRTAPPGPAADNDFERARREAEAALRQLITR